MFALKVLLIWCEIQGVLRSQELEVLVHAKRFESETTVGEVPQGL